MNKIIEIVIGPKGETKVETKGFVGGECRTASQYVENALGKRTAEHLTGEYYQGQQQASQDLRQSQ